MTEQRGVDLLVVNGRVTDGAIWPTEHESIAINEGRIVGLGSTMDLRRLTGRATHVIDAEGRRVIPGLNDGHLHVVRTGLSYDLAVSWASIRSLEEGYRRLEMASATLPDGVWLVVPGGWTDEQVEERRGPTTAELDARTGDRPAYVQCAYTYAVLNSAGMRMAGINPDGTSHDEGVEVDPETGVPTGRLLTLSSLMRTLNGIIGKPGLEKEIQGTRAFLGELRRLGLVGANDAGGFRTHPESYAAVHELAEREELDFRLRLYVHAGEPGNQVEQVRHWVRHARPRSGHPHLQFVGIGELVHYECHDLNGYDLDFRASSEALSELAEISRLAADYGWAMHAHAIQDTSVIDHLDIWEQLDGEAARINRFSIAHGELASEETLERIARLGFGMGVQARMFDTGVGASKAWGKAFVNAPRIGAIEKFGIPLGGGTDGAVGHTYNPWEALSWFVTGRAVADVPERGVEHRLSRARALDIYTHGSAWFSFEEHDRGRLAPGALGDIAILENDYFDIPDDDIASNSAWMTIIGGKVVHS